ncbi:MAG: penicillin-binding protein 2 [Chlorobia bacterium]|nr:penicillin-binding protein 2 [Fimbriimonadaceae bacterium]
MSVIHQPRKPELDARVLLFPAVLFVLLTLLFLRLWFFQVVRAEDLVEQAAALNTTDIPELAPRGLIFDRNGVMLAGIKPEWVITATPRVIDKHPEVLAKLAAELNADQKKLKAKLEEGRWKPWLPTPIFVGAKTQLASNIAERSDEFPGVDVRSQPMRQYRDTKSFSHLMGYVWVPSVEDVERIESFAKKTADYVGQGGIEESYEKNLMGQSGEMRMELDSKRRPTKVVGRDASVPGSQVILSIDKNLQQEAMSALGNYRGAVVALDPNTGEVLCMASAPSFDLGLFKNGISRTDFDAYQNNPSKPFLNRPTQVKFAPGSTFKLVTTIAAMETGYFNPNRPENCQGGIKVGNRFIKCLGHHGSVTFHNAMVKSCNAYFMSLALKSGRAGMVKAALDVGVYQKTGLDLPSERRGDIATEAYMAQYYPKAGWYDGDTAHLGIGQGILAVTPIQMANIVALVANDGVNFKPRLVRAIRDPVEMQKVELIKPTELHKVGGSPAFWATMKSALVDVIQRGTARSAQIPGMTWGGKTGRAEEKKGRKTHSWFIGFAPYDKPKIAICVFIEEGGHGGEIAAPIAKRVVQRYLLPPKDSKAASKSATVPPAAVDLSRSPID